MLWATYAVREGFSKAFGVEMRRVIAAGTKNRLRGFISGAGVTALLQSSTATALLLISFSRSRSARLPELLAVMIGADVSTTLVAQVVSFDISWLPYLLITFGFIGWKSFKSRKRFRYIAEIIVGLGLMLLALSLIREASIPLKHSETLPLIISPLDNDPVLAVLLALIVTWIIHSSLAAILLFASLAASGIVSHELGLWLVLGANIGGGLVPFAATYKDGVNARRITFGNVLMRLVTASLVMPFIPVLAGHMGDFSDDPARQVINAHTAFNLMLAVIWLPMVGYLTGLLYRIFPDPPKAENRNAPLYLNFETAGNPVVALTGATRETMRIAEIVEHMLEETIKVFEARSFDSIRKIRKADNQVDSLFRSLKLFMTKLSQTGFDEDCADRYIRILTFATNLEHIGDIIDKSLMELAEKKIRMQENFSPEGYQEIRDFHSRVLDNMKMAQTIFMSEDTSLAQRLVEQKQVVRAAADETSEKHFKRLQSGRAESIATSSLHLDIIRDYRRINSYLTRVAFSILDRQVRAGKADPASV